MKNILVQIIKENDEEYSNKSEDKYFNFIENEVENVLIESKVGTNYDKTIENLIEKLYETL